MAPTDLATVASQSCHIINLLLDDNDRCLEASFCVSGAGDGVIETDGGIEVDGPDEFDAAAIAEKLKSVADKLDNDVHFRDALEGLKKAAVQEAADTAFTQCVETLCQAPEFQHAEVAAEMQLLKASVAVALYVKKSFPYLKDRVQRSMTSFFSRRVDPWVTQKGGWEKVKVI